MLTAEMSSLLNGIAAGIHRRRLGFPVLLALDIVGPFSGLTSAGLHLVLPWLDTFVSTRLIKEMIARPDGSAILCAELAERLDILSRS